MGKVILHFHISLDGIVSDPSWADISDEILRHARQYYDSVDAVCFGSRTYPAMAAYWKEAEASSQSAEERQFAAQINSIRKFVVSRSSVELCWNNSELLLFTDTPSFANGLSRLKQRGNISIESGIGLWNIFLENNLYDELMMFLEPVHAGGGERLHISTKHKHSLRTAHPFQNGVVLLHYSRLN